MLRMFGSRLLGCRLRPNAAIAAIEADVAHCAVRGVFAVGMSKMPAAKIIVVAIICKGAAVPTAAEETEAVIAEAVIDPAVNPTSGPQ